MQPAKWSEWTKRNPVTLTIHDSAHAQITAQTAPLLACVAHLFHVPSLGDPIALQLPAIALPARPSVHPCYTSLQSPSPHHLNPDQCVARKSAAYAASIGATAPAPWYTHHPSAECGSRRARYVSYSTCGRIKVGAI